MTTIRERDVHDDLDRWPWFSDKEVRSALCDAALDRRALLAAGDALAEAARELVDAIDDGRMFTNKVLRVRAALAAWKAATG